MTVTEVGGASPCCFGTMLMLQAYVLYWWLNYRTVRPIAILCQVPYIILRL